MELNKLGKPHLVRLVTMVFKCKNYGSGYHTKLPINMDESCVNKLFFFEILNLDFSQINSTKDNFNKKDNYL